MGSNSAILCRGVVMPGFIQAQLDWFIAGGQYRPAEEIVKLYSVCQTCEQFRTGLFAITYCQICDCRLSTEVSNFNKIALATEDCPLGRWEKP